MAIDGEKVQFCDGCTGQGQFVGEVSLEAAEVSVKIPEYMGGRVELRMHFSDIDTGQSQLVFTEADTTKIRAAGVDIHENKKGMISNLRTVEKGIRRMTSSVSEDMVTRIGRCAHAAINSEGRRYCPAFDSTMFRLMIESHLTTTDEV